MSFDDILIPTDGSECAEVAMRYAEDLAIHYGATVHVLCVVDSRLLENASHYDHMKEESTEIAGRAYDVLSETGLAG
ncbi:universal stress protein [Haladaptatus pallidirubidus]|uniref:UspA domain-containing protein n=1 Tax=Haladaptatus pallidirubidus TaxID=1008152 RepID=A0AAV3URA7_9EURY|nr:universal stress protein [Haladaptatus pallidirubidus]